MRIEIFDYPDLIMPNKACLSKKEIDDINSFINANWSIEYKLGVPITLTVKNKKI